MTAKINTPRIERVLLRKRLFKELDKARQQSITWISAPAGAGKTTLVASYLATRNLPHVWYQLDEGDADPASFFYHMGQAIKTASPNASELPLLTPEYLSGITIFARNFFRELGSQLKFKSCIVLDNYQELSNDCLLNSLLATGLSELPENLTVLVLSRLDPPPPYARLQASRVLSIINNPLLQLTIEETKEFLHLYQSKTISDELAELAHARTHGWAAGVVLFLQQEITETRSIEFLESEDLPSALLNYFAFETMNQINPALQDFLLRSALLPQMTADTATQLTGNSHAGELLNNLVQRNYFIATHTGKLRTYEYHPLFREFLLTQAAKLIPPNELRKLQKQAARLLIDNGQVDAAIVLLHKAGESEQLVKLLLTQAPSLVSQGRYNTLQTWLSLVPATLTQNNPWVIYWSGIVHIPSDPLEARIYFEQAYQQFKQTNQVDGAYQSWASIIETFVLMWDDFTEIKLWLEEYTRLREQHPTCPVPQIESRVQVALFEAMIYTQPQIPEIQHAREHVESLLHTNLDANFKIKLINSLALYYSWTGRFNKQKQIIDLGCSILESHSVAPLSLLMAAFFQATYLWLTGEIGEADSIMHSAQQTADKSGIHIMDALIEAQIVYKCGIQGNVVAMGQALERLQPIVSPRRRLDVAHFHYQMGWYFGLKCDYPLALTHNRQALELAIQLSALVPLALCRIGLAQTLALIGSYDEALEHLEPAQAFARNMSSEHMQFMAGVVRAYVYYQKGQHEKCAQALRCTFQVASNNGYWTMPTWNPAIMGPICSFALQHQIEPTFVRALIRKWNLPPESPTVADTWPWPIKIYTLGRFSIVKDDVAISFIGKAQKKPLELLKVLIAQGGRDVDDATLAEAVWPDAEGDLAKQNLKSNIHRLRKLLHHDALQWHEGKLTLNPHTCWVDAWTLERQLNLLLAHFPTITMELQLQVDKVITLYHGPFLQGDEHPYAIGLRERLRSKLLRLLSHVSEHLYKQGDYTLAIRYYQQGLELEILAEGLYQGLMRCYQQLGQFAEALAVYQRCQAVFKSVLDISPSSETIALAKTLQKTAH